MVLSGAAVHISGLAAYLASELSLPAETRDALQGLQGLPNDPPLHDPQYRPVSLTPLVGVGLAADDIRINLVPDSIRMRRSLTEKARRLTWLGILLMATLFAISNYATTKLFLKRDRLRGLEAEIRAAAPAVEALEKERRIIQAVKEREDSRFSLVNVLAEVHALSTDVVLEAVDYSAEKRQVVLEGTAATMKDVTAFGQRLEASPILADAKGTRPTTSDEKTGRVSFQMACSLEKGP